VSHVGRVLIHRDCFGNCWVPQNDCAGCTGSSGDFLPPSPLAEKTTDRED
jgi:hypothetical protein